MLREWVALGAALASRIHPQANNWIFQPFPTINAAQIWNFRHKKAPKESPWIKIIPSTRSKHHKTRRLCKRPLYDSFFFFF